MTKEPQNNQRIDFCQNIFIIIYCNFRIRRRAIVLTFKHFIRLEENVYNNDILKKNTHMN